MTFPSNGGTGAVRVAVRSGVRRVTESSTPVPVPPSLPDEQALIDRLRQPHLTLTARPDAVPCARHHASQMLWDMGLKELIEPVELVVSEIVTNAVRASGGLDLGCHQQGTGEPLPIVCLWLVLQHDGMLVLVWDANPSLPERRSPGLDDDGGRGLLLVEMLSAAWGSFKISDKPGKVVWALCQS